MRVVLDVLKSPIFVIQKLALHENGVEFHQQSIGDIRISLATFYDVVRRRKMESKTHSTTHSQSHVWRQKRCQKITGGCSLNEKAQYKCTVQ